MKKFLLAIAIIFSGITSSYASHLMGGEITYTHISGNDYEVTLIIYRDCIGIPVSTTQNVTFESASCGQNFNFSIPFIQTNDVSQVCPGQTTTCNGGTVPGTQQYVFRGTVTLTPCSDWIMHWNNGTRNPATTNLTTPGSQNLYIQNTLNNVIGAFNNSPQFFNIPTPYLCVNQLAIYSHAASDADGDSLYYSFSNPLTTPGPPGTAIPFTAGYSLLQPMITTSGMNLNQQTGEMCFTPSQTQISVVSVIIDEFRNGVQIGSQIREMQVIVDATCTNQNPTTGAVATCGGSGGMTVTVAGPSVTQTDPNSVTMCPNDNVCLEITFSDPDPADNITVLDNIAAAIPGATWSVANDGTPNPIGTFCWTPTALDSGINVFSIILEDDACPISGTQTFTYDITVFDEPYAGADQIICGTQAAQLNATGGATYTWYYVATNTQVPVGPEFSCNPCFNPLALPSITTDYYVLSSLTAACENTDTVRVTVVPDFVPDAIGDTTLCDYLTRQLDVNIVSGPPNVAPFYTYVWNNAGTLNNPNIQNPIASPTDSTWYVVEVTSPDGCAKTVDSVLVGVVPPAPVNIFPGDSTICLGEVLNFSVGFVGCELADTVTGLDNDPATDATINNFSCVPPGSVITAMTMDAGFTGAFCGVTSWYTYDIIINGVTQFTQQCNLTGLDLTPFLPITSIVVSANDEDNFGDNVTLYIGVDVSFVNNAYNYSWSPATNLSNPLIGDPIYTSTAIGATTYTVTITDPGSGCSFDRSQDITVSTNNLNIPTIVDTFFCEGSSVTVDGNPNADPTLVTFDWIPTGGNAQMGSFNQGGSYAVIVSNGVCVDTSNFVTVTEIQNPHPVILGNTVICAGETTTLSVDPVYDSYLWGNGSTFDSTIVLSTAGNIQLVVDSAGCSTTVAVTVAELPVPFTTITGVDTICPGATINLGTTGSFSSYLWSPSNATSSSITTTSGLISVTISQNGCDYTTDATIYTYPNPVADFTISPEASGEPNIDIVFTDASTNASSWIWDFDVTNISSNPSNETGAGPFTFVYDNQGTYTVSLSVADDNGCTNSITKEYLIFSDIGTPNIITPNGDGMNDFLVFQNLDASLFPNHITVLNRWGKEVYTQDNYKNDWDGDNLKEGTYFYVLQVDFNSGEEIFKGTLTILR